MSAYLQLAATAFSRGLAYRTSVFLRILANIIALTIQVAIWRAVLEHDPPEGAVARLDEMVTYAVLSTCTTTVLLTRGTLLAISRRLKSGDIATDLLKPTSYPAQLACDGLGTCGFDVLFAALPTLLVAVARFEVCGPASLASFAGFLGALGIALALSFVLGYCLALLAFWFLQTFHFEWALRAVMKLFAGSVVPLWFFPGWFGEIASLLPFRFMNFVPAAIYLGKIPNDQLAPLLLTGVAWVAALAGLAAWLWSRAIRRLVVQGG